MKRGYNQYCGVARALDVLGDRWSLLIVRTLLLRPRRYKELLSDLPGIGTNLLASRLKELDRCGVVERSANRAKQPPTYRLTQSGEALEPVILALGRWGSHLLGEPEAGQLYRLEWALLSMRSMFRADRAKGIRETYEFRVGDEIVHVAVDDGRAQTGAGPAKRPDLVISCDMQTLLRLGTGRLSPKDALGSGDVHLVGDRAAFRRCMRMFQPSAPQPTSGRSVVTSS